jgi:hypothetical protein
VIAWYDRLTQRRKLLRLFNCLGNGGRNIRHRGRANTFADRDQVAIANL